MVESRTFVPAFPANPRAPNGFLYVCKKERAKISSGRGRIGNDSKPGGNAYEQDVRRKRDGGVDPSSRLASSPDRDRLHDLGGHALLMGSNEPHPFVSHGWHWPKRRPELSNRTAQNSGTRPFVPDDQHSLCASHVPPEGRARSHSRPTLVDIHLGSYNGIVSHSRSLAAAAEFHLESQMCLLSAWMESMATARVSEASLQ